MPYTEADTIHVPCPHCEADAPRLLTRQYEVLGVVQCGRCRLLYVTPRLREPDKIYWGKRETYWEEARLVFEGRAAHHRDPNYRADWRRIRRYVPGGRILDVGCNAGFFLRLGRGQGWDLYGVDPSPTLSALAREQFGLNVQEAFLEQADYPEGFFDVVTLSDVFEHLWQPRAMLAAIRRVLRPDGLLYIKVPNGAFNILKWRLARLARAERSFDLFDAIEHVVHYTEGTLRTMLEGAGFRVEEFAIDPPVQVPVWKAYVGRYYQYPTPWLLDPVLQTARQAFYLASLAEWVLRGGHIGACAPNLVVVARCLRDPAQPAPAPAAPARELETAVP